MEKINFEHVSVYFENEKGNIVTAIDDISFSFIANKINVVVGYSGSGKSTLLKCITGTLVYEARLVLMISILNHFQFKKEVFPIWIKISTYTLMRMFMKIFCSLLRL